MICVLIADDHPLIRRGMRALLDKAKDIKIVGEAKNGQEAVEMVKDLHPDLVVMDIVMPQLNGIKAMQQIRKLGVATQVLIVSMHDDRKLVQHALEQGARGYLLKRTVYEELLVAIRQIGKGRVFLSRFLPS